MQSRFLTDLEVARIASGMSPEAWLPLQITAETGLRVGDVLKLRHGDLSGTELTYTAQKTGKQGRAPLTAQTAAALLRQSQRAAGRGSPWIFPSPRDPARHLSRQAVWKRVKRAAACAGIDCAGTSPHSLRKVFAVQEYHRAGIEAARRALQHTDLTTTELYALSDWITGENAGEPITRGDLPRVLSILANWLGIAVEKSN